MSGILVAIVLGYGAVLVLVFAFQRNLLYLPSREVPVPADFGVPEMAEVELTSEDGLALKAWYLEARDGRPTVVYFQGNAGHIGHRGGKVRPYIDAGFGLLLAGYRGYGGNPGTPTEPGLYADGRAALRYLRERGVAAAGVALYGESLGGGIAVELALDFATGAAGAIGAVGAVVLETPFTSVPDVAARHYWYLPARWLARDRFDSEAKIGKIGAPLLVLLGGRDRIVPIKYGRALFAAAGEPKELKIFPEAGHNDIYDFGAAEAVIEYLNTAISGKKRPNP